MNPNAQPTHIPATVAEHVPLPTYRVIHCRLQQLEETCNSLHKQGYRLVHFDIFKTQEHQRGTMWEYEDAAAAFVRVVL